MEGAYAQALYTAIQNGTDPKKAVHALADKLKSEGRFALMHRIGKAFVRIAEREGGKTSTKLFIAREKDTHAAQQAAAKFATVEKHEVHVDETLIGGWRLETGDRLVDASYKKHLLDIFTKVTA